MARTPSRHASKERQCMEGLVPQQMANAGGVRLVFFKEIETKNKENKNPLENEMRKTQYEKHNTEGR